MKSSHTTALLKKWAAAAPNIIHIGSKYKKPQIRLRTRVFAHTPAAYGRVWFTYNSRTTGWFRSSAALHCQGVWPGSQITKHLWNMNASDNKGVFVFCKLYMMCLDAIFLQRGTDILQGRRTGNLAIMEYWTGNYHMFEFSPLIKISKALQICPGCQRRE